MTSPTKRRRFGGGVGRTGSDSINNGFTSARSALASNGFCTASEALSISAADPKDTIPPAKNSEIAGRSASFSTAAAAAAAPPFSGFCTASEAMAANRQETSIAATASAQKENAAPRDGAGNHNRNAAASSCEAIAVKIDASSYNNLPLDVPFQLHLMLRGTGFYKMDDKPAVWEATKRSTEATLALIRQPDNQYDANAIRVCMVLVRGGEEKSRELEDNGEDESEENEYQTIGHVAKEQAALLAPLMDGDVLAQSVTLEGRDSVDRTAYNMNVKGQTKNVPEILTILHNNIFARITNIDALCGDLAKLDLKQSQSAHYSIDQLPEPMPWSPIEDYERDQVKTAEFNWPWEPYGGKNAVSLRRFLSSKAEVLEAKRAQWPPSDDILRTLGMGPANDAEWWKETAGLKPPIEWTVEGPHDLLPVIALSRQAHRDKACQELDGAVHGVTGVWLDETLDQMREAMHQKDFWCHRGNDAFIRSFGGPYVLGQKEGALKLVKGTPHTDLTTIICRAHNLVYAATHLKLPSGPGFNTIVFGLNLRRAGFHYHQDSVGELPAKNAPLCPRQPVVTTVFYEAPEIDDKKEVVNWRPMLNWSPATAQQKNLRTDGSVDDDNASGFYLAARTVRTTHGMIHVQRAGLQARTKHGIFHCPGSSEERKGYRVAITARIAWPDSEERLSPYAEKESYCRVFGPEGKDTIPNSTI